MRRYNWMNSSIFDKELIIWGAPFDFPKKSFLNNIKENIKNSKMISGYNLSNEDLGNLYKLLSNKKFDILNSYPSILEKFVDFSSNTDLYFKPKSIVIGGEKLFLEQKNKIKNFFDSNIYDFYGARDMPNIAQSCIEDNGLHIFSENVIVEVVDDNGLPIKSGEGDLVITNLHNYVMPFIRYKIGDRARVSDYKKCNCGINLPLIDEVIGRKMELIKFPNGNRVMGSFWTLLIRSYEGIQDFKVVQKSLEEINIYYTINNKFDKKILSDIDNKIHEFGGLNFKVEFIKKDKIRYSKAGKMNFIVSEVN